MVREKKKIKVSVIFGTRPEAIKLSPVIRELKRENTVECKVCVTAQHREMLDQVLDVFGIVPDEDLKLMRPNQTLSGFTARAILALEKYMFNEKPDIVVVQGDTSTVFVASLVAFYKRIPVGHVEAGLRTGNIQSPWPEEANRVLTSHISTLHFAPTLGSKNNLLKEGIPEENIIVTGNTVIDALFMTIKKLKENNAVIEDVIDTIGERKKIKKIILITGHRRENIGKGFEGICRAIRILAIRYPDIHYVYPVHLNPNVRSQVMQILDRNGDRRLNNVHLINPLPYLSFVALMKFSTLILTDSGGIQEEAPSIGKPVLVMRENSERPEAIAAGTALLVGTSEEKIVQEVSRLLTDEKAYKEMSQKSNPYGDGLAAKRIVKNIIKRYSTYTF